MKIQKPNGENRKSERVKIENPKTKRVRIENRKANKNRKLHYWATVKFWVHVKRLMSRPSHPSLLVDGVNGKTEVANIFDSKFSALLNKHSSSSRNSLLATIQSSLTSPHIFSVTVTEDQVSAAISQLKPHKSDASSVSSEHIKFASPVIITPLSLFFTAVLHHGHMPQCFQDSVIVPVSKAKKDPSKSLNYRPITLSSSFSKILERLFLSNYQSFLTTSCFFRELVQAFKRMFSVYVSIGM